MRVKAHRNLNAPGGVMEWSITPLEGEFKGKVALYAEWICLSNVTFRVQQGGVKRIRREKRKSVVAWCVGELDSMAIQRLRLCEKDTFSAQEAPSLSDITFWERIRFNPYLQLHFFKNDGQPVAFAEKVMLDGDGHCYAQNTQ